MPQTITLGGITIDRIVEQDRLPFMDFRTFFPGVTPEMLEANRHWLQPTYLDVDTGKLVITVQSYLVRTGSLTILIDTCVGNHKERTARPAWQPWHKMASDTYERNLAAFGVGVADIDLVLCTHLHVDHVGWNTRLDNGRWVPTFPKARYMFADRELDFWSKRAAIDPTTCPWMADSVLPIVAANRADTVTSLHEITDAIRLVPTPGHTIDHFSVEVGRPGADALITGDMVHSPIQMLHPEIGMVSDYDQVQSAETRRRVFSRCCETSTLLCTAHFPGQSVGRVARAGDAFRFVEG
jgi:glyoxylase-like metal-dependent hydrolase (beta-lactamase superfamily II)